MRRTKSSQIWGQYALFDRGVEFIGSLRENDNKQARSNLVLSDTFSTQFFQLLY